jgi:glycosyltransferase involved in cell wall biosynthesis
MRTPSKTTEYQVILVAPNVSAQMGGEAMKALQIYLELERQGVAVHQITHARVQPELDTAYPEMHVSYLPDTLLEKMLFRGRIFELLLNMVFLYRATSYAKELRKQSPHAVVHFTSPISPVLPYPNFNEASVVIGPINGNIHYPPGFRQREPLAYKLRRWLHPLLQRMQRIGPRGFTGKRQAGAILVAGGRRTAQSLLLAGCQARQFVESIDSGIPDRLFELPRIEHTGVNPRFYFTGRLVGYKGADLAIESLVHTRQPIQLDIIGRGRERVPLEQLVAALGLQDRVTFLDWMSESELASRLRLYRGFIFPSLAEANGIVVQEAMVMGMPVIACDWGGPSLLLTPETGFAIQPIGENHVVREIAARMDQLAEDPALAEHMSIRARERAIARGFLWSGVIRDWRRIYQRVLADRETRSAINAK